MVFEQKFAFSLLVFLFTCGNFTLIFTIFSIFWIGFFLNGFTNPFLVHSRHSFFEPNFNFSLVLFTHMRHFNFDFLFFFFKSIFIRNGFFHFTHSPF